VIQGPGFASSKFVEGIPVEVFLMDVFKTDAGYISGTILGDPDKPVHVFRGIPYAAPPVGDLRWKPPQPVTPWPGIRECTAFSSTAPQSTRGPLPSSGLPQGEDCLYLNVLTPASGAGDRLPVMVWMHGGGFVSGSGNQNYNNATMLPLKGVVLVNVNMRLRELGCLAHPLLSRESPEGVSGNYLFLDMLAALKWTRRNISAFGGDPDNVTIFGESGGSAKVINLMASPLAKGLFHRAIGQSYGSHGTPLKEMESLGQQLFRRLGVENEKDPLAAARAVPYQKLIEADIAMTADLGLSMYHWDSSVDGWFLSDTPANTFKAGRQNAVPFIMGANLGELTGPGLILIPEVISEYVNLFTGANKAGIKTYAYVFGHVPAGWKRSGVVAVHGMELPYLFGNRDSNDYVWAVLFALAKPSGAKSADPGFTDADRQVSELIMTMWTNFARTGDPGMPGVVDWPAWDEAMDRYLYVTEEPEVKSGFSKVAQK
jgi:para-nitrobenzyl esterase